MCFSPDGSGKLFAENCYFLNKKERPAEAPFLFLEKKSDFQKNLKRTAGLASYKSKSFFNSLTASFT
jgi:hypothetical protein